MPHKNVAIVQFDPTSPIVLIIWNIYV